MALTKRKNKSSSFLEDVNSLSIFGKYQPEDLIELTQEEQEREKRFIEAQTQRELEIKKQDEREKEEEAIYRKWKSKEQKKLQKINGSSSNAPSKPRGRGALLNADSFMRISEKKPRGRGRLSPWDKQSLPLFERAGLVEKNIRQHNEESNLFKNAEDKKFWTGRTKTNDEEEEEYDLQISDSYTNFTDSSSAKDQFEDAESSPYTSSALSFNSAPSGSSGSPMSAASPLLEPLAATNISPPLPDASQKFVSSPRPRKPRASRLAARFTYNMSHEDIDDQTAYEQKRLSSEKPEDLSNLKDESNEDPLAVLSSSPWVAPVKLTVSHRLASGTSFNSLGPSQRVLSDDILADLFKSDDRSSNHFTLNPKDFPKL